MATIVGEKLSFIYVEVYNSNNYVATMTSAARQ